jgi:hypothetical protein
MIHFYHQTTFLVLTHLVILALSSTQDKISLLQAQLVKRNPVLAEKFPNYRPTSLSFAA